MGSNHMHYLLTNTVKKNNKENIPTHDPYTGELNPYYEELTGEKNPYAFKVETIDKLIEYYENSIQL
jgi:hypothetical protein